MLESPFVACVVSPGLARGLLAKEREAPADASAPVGAIVLIEGARTEVLAAPDSARAELYRLLGRRGVDPLHPQAVRDELPEILASPGIDDPELVDRRDLPFVTIDNADSRDLDQALFVEEREGGYRVHYALADASYYVRPGTRLLREALERGTSYYLPSLCVPMLPTELSEGLVSLNAEVDRRAVVFVLDVDERGYSTHTSVERARIRSRAKLSYPGVQALHDDPESSPLLDREFSESLRLLRVVGELRIERARERGVVEFDRSELELSLDEAGERFVVGVRARNDCERWNEQLSLLCNTEGAELLERGGPLDHVQPVFRVHPPPLLGRLDELEATINALVQERALDEVWRWRRDADEPLADYLVRLEELNTLPRVFATIRRQVRYSNRASSFQADAGPHHALGVEGYARFSAPMREVVGIFTHKEGLERLGLAKPSDSEDDRDLRERAIQVANDSKRKQSALTKEANGLAIDQLLKDDLQLPLAARPLRAGTVFGLRSSRLYVALDTFPIELKVYRDDLERLHNTRYRAHGEVAMLPTEGEGPSFRLGDGVVLRTLAHDPERRRWSFEATHEPA